MASQGRRLIRADALADPGAAAFTIEAPGGARGRPRHLFAVRVDERIAVFVNACPHAWARLDQGAEGFFGLDGVYLVCSLHGAEFRPWDGLCVSGPCRGQRLERVPFRLVDGWVEVDAAN